ncbi:hypothetical protein [Aequorivita sp. KMM 9714]|uniref:hypothetical protein n=1 Tax=Aequorivita sp. KMM 9714 TaxID=2707173 RepID=UPI0013E9EBC9|nr:hypothetical protein [Aequorivita sp. KMM 9714]NGX84883.1 hypothetical protein [Aequorivita sp. KMM 9714]
MKQKLIILFFALQFVTSYSQHKDEYGFDFELRSGTAFLIPSWNNIFNTITMPHSVFNELMDKYGYEFILDKNYWWKMSELDNCDFFIEKDKYSISFIWKNVNIDTQELEDNFEQYLVKKLENGMKIYSIQLENNSSFEMRIFNYQKLGVVSFERKL